MARNIRRMDTGGAAGNIIVGIILIIISVNLGEGRFETYIGVGGLFLIGSGLYSIYTTYKSIFKNNNKNKAPIVDGRGYNDPSVKLNTEAAWYLFERGLRYREYYKGTCSFIFESSVPKGIIEQESQDYPIHNIVNNISNRSNFKPHMVNTVKDYDIDLKNKRYKFDYGVLVTMKIPGRFFCKQLELLISEVFREVDDEYMEGLGHSPNKDFIFDYNPNNKIKLDEVKNRLLNRQSTNTVMRGNLQELG